jgi:uncharacterized protein YjiK
MTNKLLLPILLLFISFSAVLGQGIRRDKIHAQQVLKADDSFIWKGDTIHKDSILYAEWTADSLRFKLIGGSWSIWIKPGTGSGESGSTSFDGLTDTPSSKVAGKLIQANDAGTSLEYTDTVNLQKVTTDSLFLSEYIKWAEDALIKENLAYVDWSGDDVDSVRFKRIGGTWSDWLHSAGNTSIDTVITTDTTPGFSKYDIEFSTNNLEVATGNVSDVAYSELTGTVFISINDPEVIYEYDLEGNHLRTITMTNFNDTEGFCWMSGTLFAVCQEVPSTNPEIYYFNITGGTTTIDAVTDATKVTTSITAISNRSLEGITYNATDDVFYVCAEKESDGGAGGQVWEVEMDGTSTEYVGIRALWAARGYLDMAALWWDDVYEQLYVLSQESNKIVRMTLNGTPLETVSTNVLFGQPEGLGFSKDRTKMFVSGEDDDLIYYLVSSDTVVTTNPDHFTDLTILENFYWQNDTVKHDSLAYVQWANELVRFKRIGGDIWSDWIGGSSEGGESSDSTGLLNLGGFTIADQTDDLPVITINASDVAYNDSTGTIFVLTQWPNALNEYETNGDWLRTIILSGYGDPEGLCWMGGNLYGIGMEDPAPYPNIYIATITSETTVAYEADATKIVTDIFTETNKGLEGLTWDIENEWFYVCAEKSVGADIGRVFKVLLTGGSTEYEDLGDAWEAAGYTDMASIWYDNTNGQICILSDQSKLMVRATFGGEILEVKTLSWFTKPEGLSINPTLNEMWVVGEGDEFIHYIDYTKQYWTIDDTRLTPLIYDTLDVTVINASKYFQENLFVDFLTFPILAGNQTFTGVNTFNQDLIIPAETYGTGWNSSNQAPTKNDTYDKMELVRAEISALDFGDTYLDASNSFTGVNSFTQHIAIPTQTYGVGWNGVYQATTKDAVYDKIELVRAEISALDFGDAYLGGPNSFTGVNSFTQDIVIPAETYGASWNGSNQVPTKNDVYDKIETVSAGGGGISSSDNVTWIGTHEFQNTFEVLNDITLLSGADRTLSVSTPGSGDGFDLTVHAGSSALTGVGGNLNLFAGNSSLAGGNIYIYGGTGSTAGQVWLGYTSGGFRGEVYAKTQSASDNSQKVATTAYVDAASSGGGYWDRSGTDLTTTTAGDDLVMDDNSYTYFGGSKNAGLAWSTSLAAFAVVVNSTVVSEYGTDQIIHRDEAGNQKLVFDSGAASGQKIWFKDSQYTTGSIAASVDIDATGQMTADGFAAKVQTVTYSASQTMDWDSGANATITLAGNISLTINNVPDGGSGSIVFIQDGTGSRTLTLNGGTGYTTEKWRAGEKTLSITANATDIISYKRIGSVLYCTLGKDWY